MFSLDIFEHYQKQEFPGLSEKSIDNLSSKNKLRQKPPQMQLLILPLKP
jgi:hypothetical protein